MFNHAAGQALVRELNNPPPPGSSHGVPIPGSQTPGRSAIYRNWAFCDKPLLSTIDPAVRTLHDLFESAAKEYSSRPCLGWRRWLPESKTHEAKFQWMTYGELATRRHHFGTGFAEIRNQLGLDKSLRGVGLWSTNRPEWQIADLGCMSQGLYTVSLYETLGPNATEFIMNHADLTSVVCSLAHLAVLLNLAPKLPLLKLIVILDPLEQGEEAHLTKRAILEEIATERGISLWSLDRVEKLGKELRHPMRPVEPTDLYTINYTSGTSGEPKGVMITHSSAIASNCATRVACPLTPDAVGISYLPLAHVMQRLVEHAIFANGARIGYFNGDILKLGEDFKLLRPTIFSSVPRLFNRFYSTIHAATVEADGFKGTLSKHVVETKLAAMRLPNGRATHSHWLYDRVWTSKIRAALGFDRLEHLFNGSAPLDPQVQVFLSAALGVNTRQGYGMTETSGAVTVQLNGDYSTSNVGAPSPCAEMCVEDVPELQYYATDKPYPRGELLVRGPAVCAGYLKNDEENAKAMDKDGWLHTGDIAAFDELGRVKIIDRKKNIVKLSQGEYVAPEQIQNVYLSNTNLIAMAFVHGDSLKSSLVGIFDVNLETFAPFAAAILQKENVDPADLKAVAELAEHPEVKREFIKVLDKIGRDKGLAGFQRVKNALLKIAPFTVDNGIVTPTLKLKRPAAAKAFQKEIEQMYAEIEDGPTKERLKL